MIKVSTLECSFLRFLVPLLIVISFCFANSAGVATELSGYEAKSESKLVNQDLATKNPEEAHDEDAKFKGFFHPKPIFEKPFFKKPNPIVKPIPKSVPIVKPIPKSIPVVKPIPKPVPIVKPVIKPVIVKKPVPIPVAKPVPNPIPIVKPIPVFKPIPVLKPIPIVKPIPIFKPIPKPISFVKPFPKPFSIPKKSFFSPQNPEVKQESFLKSKPFFEKSIPKLPFYPEFKKPILPSKPIPNP